MSMSFFLAAHVFYTGYCQKELYYVFKQICKNAFWQDFKIVLFVYNVDSFNVGI